jgi:hypothetical protein
MLPFAEWFPLALAGVTFTALGGFKVYGLRSCWARAAR